MEVVQCFKCQRYVDVGASEMRPTQDFESFGSTERPWCGSCLRELKENTEEALRDMEAIAPKPQLEAGPSDEVSTEISEEDLDGWVVAESFDEVRELLGE